MIALLQTQALQCLSQWIKEAALCVSVEPLTEADKDAALDFLGARPVHTVLMAGWIMEHGIESPQHRGRFYGCWNAVGTLEGVALIGRATTFETHTEAAIIKFAELAKQNPSVQLLFAEATQLDKFWCSYRHAGQLPRLVCRELLYEKEVESFKTIEVTSKLRKARPEELKQVASAHAQIVAEETGINPLDKDSAGFYQRCATRIENGKIWVLMEQGELIFKADVIAETADVVYIEGLWVNPLYRRKGYGQLGWEALNQALLLEKISICGFVNDDNESAKAFYQKVGCRPRARFSKILV